MVEAVEILPDRMERCITRDGLNSLLRNCSGDSDVFPLQPFRGEQVVVRRPGTRSPTRQIAWRFNVSLVETDLFLTEGHGRMMHRKEEIARIIKKRIDIPRPVIVEGCAVLRLLADLNRSPDFLIYLTSQDAPIVHGDLAADLTAYDAKFSPRSLAGLALAIDQSIRADGSLGCTN